MKSIKKYLERVVGLIVVLSIVALLFVIKEQHDISFKQKLSNNATKIDDFNGLNQEQTVIFLDVPDDLKQLSLSFKNEVSQVNQPAIRENWQVKLATFANQTNAKRLVANLLDNNVQGYYQTITHNNNELYVVYAKTEGNNSKLDADFLAKQLKAKYKLDGIIVNRSELN